MHVEFDELLEVADKMVRQKYPSLIGAERAKLAVELCRTLVEYEKAHIMAIRTDRGMQ